MKEDAEFLLLTLERKNIKSEKKIHQIPNKEKSRFVQFIYKLKLILIDIKISYA